MTILGPILMAAVFIVPMILAMNSEEKSNIAIVDETGVFAGKFSDTDKLSFTILDTPIEEAKEDYAQNGYDDLLYIPRTEMALPTSAVIYAKDQVSVTTKSYIRGIMKDEVEAQKMMASGIDPEILNSIKTNINLSSFILGDDGEETKSYAEVSMAVGYVGGLLIYMFIFIYGSMVMRGVIEEKVSRIVEVIVSSVKPFQLMMGKIIGVGLVGFTQFMLWVVLTLIIVTGFQQVMPEKFNNPQAVESFNQGSRIPGGSEATETLKTEEDPGSMNKIINLCSKKIFLPFKNANGKKDLLNIDNLTYFFKCLLLTNPIPQGYYYPTDNEPISLKDIALNIRENKRLPQKLINFPLILKPFIKLIFNDLYKKLFEPKIIFKQPILKEIFYEPKFSVSDGLKKML